MRSAETVPSNWRPLWFERISPSAPQFLAVSAASPIGAMPNGCASLRLNSVVRTLRRLTFVSAGGTKPNSANASRLSRWPAPSSTGS